MQIQKEQLAFDQRILRDKVIRVGDIEPPIKRIRDQWKRSEHAKYLAFLRKYYYIMREHKLRSLKRIFNQMAKIIVTRDINQCRSHHQHMLNKHKNSLVNIVFRGESQNQLVVIGEGLTFLSHRKIVNQDLKRFRLRSQPFLTLKVDDKLLIIINSRFVAQY